MKIQILFAAYQTLLMVIVPGTFAALIGIPLGVVLFVTRLNSLHQMLYLNKVLQILVNGLRSIPFIILLVVLIPITRLLVGSSIGTMAAIVPLTVSAIPFLARLVEAVLNEVNVGLIDAGKSMGASTSQIVIKILLPEALQGIISGITVTLINLVGYSAMAGVVGGGGLGDMAIRYGYQRSETEVMMFVIFILVLFVQSLQLIGDSIVNFYGRRG